MNRTVTDAQLQEYLAGFDTLRTLGIDTSDPAAVEMELLVREVIQRRSKDAGLVVAQLQEELEVERMRLVACMTAALGNTAETVAQRITPDHPYYSASYCAVCAAVDREMALSDRLDALEKRCLLMLMDAQQ